MIPAVGASGDCGAMTALCHHAIIASTDRQTSAAFSRSILEASDAPCWGPFTNLTLDGEVLLQFAEPPVDPAAALRLPGRGRARRPGDLPVRRRGHPGADPQLTRAGETDTEHGGRGVYFRDPAGHGVELIARPCL